MNNKPQLRKSYGTPILVKSGGKTELISPAAVDGTLFLRTDAALYRINSEVQP